MDNNLNFIIEEYDIAHNSATIKPYSPLFKNPIDMYPSFNLTLTTLDPNLDINTQIAAIFQPTIDAILAREQPIHSNVADYFANSKLNEIVSVPLSATNALYNDIQTTETESVSSTSTITVDLSSLNLNFIN